MTTEVSGFETLHGQEDYFFPKISTLVIETIQRSTECVWDGFSQGVEQSEREADHTL